MNNRAYKQACSISVALDVIGERWTLLIVRELMAAPARFSGLSQALPGISPNLLSYRLNELLEDGIVERCLIGRHPAYRLTDTGANLRPVLEELARWGFGYASAHPHALDNTTTPPTGAWLAIAFKAMTSSSRLSEVSQAEEYVFFVDGHHMRCLVGPNQFDTHACAIDCTSTHDDAALRLTASPGVITGIGMGVTNPLAALQDGSVHVTGDPAALERALRLFGFLDISDNSQTNGQP